MSSLNPGDAPFSLAAVAMRLRQIRRRAFDADLFADPAWDIVLSLCVKGPQTAPDLAAQLDLSPEMTSRWVDILLSRNLLERGPDDVLKLTAPTLSRLNMIFDNAISRTQID